MCEQLDQYSGRRGATPWILKADGTEELLLNTMPLERVGKRLAVSAAPRKSSAPESSPSADSVDDVVDEQFEVDEQFKCNVGAYRLVRFLTSHQHMPNEPSDVDSCRRLQLVRDAFSPHALTAATYVPTVGSGKYYLIDGKANGRDEARAKVSAIEKACTAPIDGGGCLDILWEENEESGACKFIVLVRKSSNSKQPWWKLVSAFGEVRTLIVPDKANGDIRERQAFVLNQFCTIPGKHIANFKIEELPHVRPVVSTDGVKKDFDWLLAKLFGGKIIQMKTALVDWERFEGNMNIDKVTGLKPATEEEHELDELRVRAKACAKQIESRVKALAKSSQLCKPVWEENRPKQEYPHNFPADMAGWELIGFEEGNRSEGTVDRFFTCTLGDYTHGIQHERRSLWIIGGAGSGKSLFQQALGRFFCRCNQAELYIFTKTIDALGLLSMANEVDNKGHIAFSDIAMKSLMNSTLDDRDKINLFSTEEDCSAPARYHPFLCGAGMTKSFSANKGVKDDDFGSYFLEQGLPSLAAMAEQDMAYLQQTGDVGKAIARRVLLLLVKPEMDFGISKEQLHRNNEAKVAQQFANEKAFWTSKGLAPGGADAAVVNDAVSSDADGDFGADVED